MRKQVVLFAVAAGLMAARDSLQKPENVNERGAAAAAVAPKDSDAKLPGEGSGTTGSGEEETAKQNQAPVAADDTVSTLQARAVMIDVLANDRDPDAGDALSISNVSVGETVGTVAISLDRRYLTFTPALGLVGTAVFTYEIRDLAGLTSSASVTVTIEGDGGSAQAENDSFAGTEDIALELAVLANDLYLIEGESVAGDSALKVASISVEPENGDAEISENFRTITYTPNENFFGEDTLSYTIDAGNGVTSSAVVQITIAGVSDPPVATADILEVKVLTAMPLDVLANDNDPDGDAITVTAIVSPPAAGTVQLTDGVLTYTVAVADGSTAQQDSLVYRITDAEGNVAEATATLNINTPPVVEIRGFRDGNESGLPQNDQLFGEPDSYVDTDSIDLLFSVTDLQNDAYTVKVEYSGDNGANWTELASGLTPGSASLAEFEGLHAYTWANIDLSTPRAFNLLRVSAVQANTDSGTATSQEFAISAEKIWLVDDVFPIFQANCVSCHGGFTPVGQLDLGQYNDHPLTGMRGIRSAMNGIHARTSPGAAVSMPPNNPLPMSESHTIGVWVMQGGPQNLAAVSPAIDAVGGPTTVTKTVATEMTVDVIYDGPTTDYNLRFFIKDGNDLLEQSTAGGTWAIDAFQNAGGVDIDQFTFDLVLPGALADGDYDLVVLLEDEYGLYPMATLGGVTIVSP